MSILATSENKEQTKKIELWTIWGHISIIHYKKVNGEYERVWSKPYQSIERAGIWFRKYEVSLLHLKPDEQHKSINIKISSEGEISLNEQEA